MTTRHNGIGVMSSPLMSLCLAEIFPPVAMFDNEIVFQFGLRSLLRYNYRSGECVVTDMVRMHDLMYANPDNNDTTCMLVEYTRANV